MGSAVSSSLFAPWPHAIIVMCGQIDLHSFSPTSVIPFPSHIPMDPFRGDERGYDGGFYAPASRGSGYGLLPSPSNTRPFPPTSIPSSLSRHSFSYLPPPPKTPRRKIQPALKEAASMPPLPSSNSV